MSGDVAVAARATVLATITAQIKAEHALVMKGMVDVVKHAILAGENLLRAKPSFDQGTWTPYLKETCGSDRTAQVYMQLAKKKDDLKEFLEKAQSPSLSKALGYLRSKKEEDESTGSVDAANGDAAAPVAPVIPASTKQSDEFDQLQEQVVTRLKKIADREIAQTYASNLVRALRYADLII
jgi:hypothetical protein